LDELMRDDPKLKAHQHGDHGAPPLDEAVNAAYLPIVQRVLERHGLNVPPVGAPFATHAGDFAAAGLPVLVLGPGDPTPAHTHKGWVALDVISCGVAVYSGLMAESSAE